MLFRRHAPHIQRYVIRRLGPDAADDIVAETFLLAFRHRPGTAHQGTERVTTRSRHRPFVILGLDLRWRLVIAAGLAAALAADLVAAQALLLRQADVSGPGVRP